MSNIEEILSHTIQGHVSLDSLAPDYPCIKVTNEHASATIALHGAHLIDYTPAGQPAVIFTSENAVYREGKAIRGGIPICWPWFNQHPEDTSLPSHGVARTQYWSLFRSFHSNDSTTLVLTCSYDQLHAELTIEVGSSLVISLKTTNTDNQPTNVGGALHTYFNISDISNISIGGLEDSTYLDTISHTTEHTKGEITVDQETDRIYSDNIATITLHDPELKRDIRIEKSGSKSTVVWNPWIEKSAGMSDLGNEEYLEFICIETANALKDIYHLAPGTSHTLSTTITSIPA